MLLAIDIGNTNIKLAAFDGERLVGKISLPTDRRLKQSGLTHLLKDKITQPIDAAIICSVVPEMTGTVAEFVASTCGVAPRVVRNDDDLGISIDYYPLEDAGADRLVNSFSAAEAYGTPVIVCSFGTAFTIDVVNAERTLTGGLIAPGLNMLPKALELATSRLPEVEIAKPDTMIQRTTVGSLRSGIVFGYFGMVEALISGVKKEAGGDDWKVVATGGSAQFVADHTSVIDVVDRDLTVIGLRRLHQRLS